MPLQQQQQRLFYGPLSGITWVSWYQKKHSPTDTYADNQSYFISFLHLLRFMVSSSLLSLCFWQSFYTISHALIYMWKL